jgi:hypothetical protein
MSSIKLPYVLRLANIGKPVEVKVYLRDGRGVNSDSLDTFVGTLEGFWYNNTGLTVKLHGFDRIVTTWAENYTKVEV